MALLSSLQCLHLGCTRTEPPILNIVRLSQLEWQVSLLVLVVSIIDSFLGWEGLISDEPISALANHLIAFDTKDILVLYVGLESVWVARGKRHMT